MLKRGQYWLDDKTKHGLYCPSLKRGKFEKCTILLMKENWLPKSLYIKQEVCLPMSTNTKA